MQATAPLYLARSVSLAAGETVQLFPPGVLKVTPTPADGSEPRELELTIDAATAEVLEAHRADYQAKADANEGDAPFLDFNHDDREASAWVKKVFWAGEDPATGGVRAEVEWSAAGEAAVQGKTFRRFSPVFYAENGRITGAPVNMGGLVNRAAFRTIQPLFAKQAEESQTTTNTTTMNEEEVTALKSENAALKEQLSTLQAKMDEMSKKDAEATVEQAAKEGRIGTAPELKAKWVDSLIKDPAAKDLLLAMAPNPALVSGPATKATEKTKDESPEALLAKYHEIADREERSAFFAKHKAALKSALA